MQGFLCSFYAFFTLFNPTYLSVTLDVVVVVVITPPLPRDRGTARMALQVHAVNLIEIRLGERWHSISNRS